jgi:hypothetical protein
MKETEEHLRVAKRVQGWSQGCQMVLFLHQKKNNLGSFCSEIFFNMFEYLMVISNILKASGHISWPFGNFVVIWNIFSPF